MKNDKYFGILVKPNGTVKPVYFDSWNVSLSDLYKYVECECIEIVRVPNTPYLMVIDDEGKLNGGNFNLRASLLYGNSYDFIVGNALILCDESAYAPLELEPDCYAMPPEHWAVFEDIIS